MCPRTEEQLAQGEGASQPTEIFHTLMSSQEAGKKLHGPLGKWRPLFFACLPQTLRFSCTYITSKRLLHRLRHSVPASKKRGFIFPTIIVIMYCAIMLWYGGGSVCPEIKMTHHDSRGLLFSGGNSLPFCPLPYTLARLWTLTDCMTGLLGRCFL